MEKAVFNPASITETLAAREHPTIMMWNRFEGRPRTHDFNKALKAEVRDALWMLTKQWQMGEFKGDDAGSPVFAKLFLSRSLMDSYKANGHAVQKFEKNVPLETKVEQKKIPFKREQKLLSIDIRLQMGRYWLLLLKKENLLYSQDYIRLYKFDMPARDRQTDHIYAHKDVWQHSQAIHKRCLDGYKLYEHIITPGKLASDDIVASNAV